MTFEMWLSQWLAARLQRSIKTVITPEAVSVTLDDVSDINKFIRESSIGAVISMRSKRDAAVLSAALQEATSELPLQNYVLSCYVETERAERIGNPPEWNYLVSMRIRHRRRDSW
jgi:hypothetical protein